MSPSKTRQRSPEKPAHAPIREEDEGEAPEDTRDMLERMRQTVQVMRRRSSVMQTTRPLDMPISREHDNDMDIVTENVEQVDGKLGETAEEDEAQTQEEPVDDDDEMALNMLQQDVEEVTVAMSSPKKQSPPAPQAKEVAKELERSPSPTKKVDFRSMLQKGKKSQKTTHHIETPSLADDEASPAVAQHREDSDDEEREEPQAKPKARLLRKRGPAKVSAV
jgi:hypothetical protein